MCSDPSEPALASQDPSGTTANMFTAPVWPVRVWRRLLVAGSQIRTLAVDAGAGQPRIRPARPPGRAPGGCCW